MTEPKLEKETPKSPYDLWPDATEPETRVTVAFEHESQSPFVEPVPDRSEPQTTSPWAFEQELEFPLAATGPENTASAGFDFPEPIPFQGPYQEPGNSNMGFDAPFEAPFVPVLYTPETTEQNVRNSGLAWSAGVVFFGSVAFMLFLGWLADLLLGSSPYGVVVGIVLGSIIGFIQFFRISSQIFSSQKPDPDHRPLLSRDDEH